MTHQINARTIHRFDLDIDDKTLHLPKDWELLEVVDLIGSFNCYIYLLFDASDIIREPVHFFTRSFISNQPAVDHDWCFLKPINSLHFRTTPLFLFCKDGWNIKEQQEWLSNHGLGPEENATSLTREELMRQEAFVA